MKNKAFRGFLGIVQVAHGQSVSANEQAAGNPVRARVHVRVQDVEILIAHGTAIGNARSVLVFRADGMQDGPDGGFGGSTQADDLAIFGQGTNAAGQVGGESNPRSRVPNRRVGGEHCARFLRHIPPACASGEEPSSIWWLLPGTSGRAKVPGSRAHLCIGQDDGGTRGPRLRKCRRWTGPKLKSESASTLSSSQRWKTGVDVVDGVHRGLMGNHHAFWFSGGNRR